MKENTDTSLKGRERRRKGPKQKLPPVMILVTAGDLGRFTNFSASISRTMAFMNPDSAIMWSVGSSVADNVNRGVDSLLYEKGAEKLEAMWLLGDDHEWDAQLMETMLARMMLYDLDILVPLCFRRSWPPAFVIYDREEDGVLRTITSESVAEILHSDEPIREVLAAGTAGMLVRRRVFEKLAELDELPAFRNIILGTDGKILSQAGEDLNFCTLARGAGGFRIHADFSLTFGHLRAVTLVPEVREGYLGMSIFFGTQTGPFLPMVAPPE